MAQIETNSAAASKARAEGPIASEGRRPPTQISSVDRRTEEDVAAIQRLAAVMKRL